MMVERMMAMQLHAEKPNNDGGKNDGDTVAPTTSKRAVHPTPMKVVLSGKNAACAGGATSRTAHA